MRYVHAAVPVLGALLYLGLFLGWFSTESGDLSWQLIIGWNGLLLVTTILAIIDGIMKVRAGRMRELATGVFLGKLAAIPFFVINFIVLALGGLAGTLLLFVRGIGLPFLIIVAIGAALTYLTMLCTSVYGWAAIARLRRDGAIGRPLAAVYAVLLLVFVADIAVGIALYVHYRLERRKQLSDKPSSVTQKSPTE